MTIVGGHARRTARRLAAIDHTVRSPCGDIKVEITGHGAIRNVRIRPGTVARTSPERMATALTAAVREAETMLIEALHAHGDTGGPR